MEIPVYLVNGFLESGKTLFIDDALKSEDFADGDKTLLIACEEGMEEYDEKKLAPFQVKIETIEAELGVPVTMVSNGPGRDEIIMRK